MAIGCSDLTNLPSSSETIAQAILPWVYEKDREKSLFLQVYQDYIREFTLVAASYLTDPVCYMREGWIDCKSYRKFYPYAGKATAIFWETAFLIKAVVGASFSYLAILGIALRASIELTDHWLGSHPFIIHAPRKNSAEYQQSTPTKELKVFQANICGVPGGYNKTDGGVENIHTKVNGQTRLQRIIEMEKCKGADFVAFYEVFDIQTARKIEKMLREKGFTSFVYGTNRAVGPASAQFYASKIPLDKVHITKLKSVGRGKNTTKAAFHCKIGEFFLTSTHLMHSEHPQSPIDFLETLNNVKNKNAETETDDVHQRIPPKISEVAKKLGIPEDRLVALCGWLNIQPHLVQKTVEEMGFYNFNIATNPTLSPTHSTALLELFEEMLCRKEQFTHIIEEGKKLHPHLSSSWVFIGDLNSDPIEQEETSLIKDTFPQHFPPDNSTKTWGGDEDSKELANDTRIIKNKGKYPYSEGCQLDHVYTTNNISVDNFQAQLDFDGHFSPKALSDHAFLSYTLKIKDNGGSASNLASKL